MTADEFLTAARHALAEKGADPATLGEPFELSDDPPRWTVGFDGGAVISDTTGDLVLVV